jgi:hypothetical protein
VREGGKKKTTMEMELKRCVKQFNVEAESNWLMNQEGGSGKGLRRVKTSGEERA